MKLIDIFNCRHFIQNTKKLLRPLYIRDIKSIFRAVAALITAAFVLTFPALGLADTTSFSGTSHANRLLSGLQFSDIAGHWARDSILKMAAMSVMQGNSGKFLPDDSVSREQALAAIIRLMGQDEEAGKLAATLKNTSVPGANNAAGAANASKWAAGYLQLALKQGIITKEEMQSLDLRRPAMRQEVAAWAVRAMKLSPLYGIQQDLMAGFKDSGQIEAEYLPYLAAAVKNGILSGSGGLLRPRDTMSRGELASFLDRIKGSFPTGPAFHRGTVLSSYTVDVRDKNAVKKIKVFEIKDSDGRRFNLQAESAVSNGWENTGKDFIVIKGGRPSLSSVLEKDNYIEYAVKNGEVLYAQVIPVSRNTVTGELSSIDINGNRIAIRDKDGRLTYYSVAAFVEVNIDGRPAGLKDLVEGFEITAYIENGIVGKLTAESGSEPGYIASGSRRVEGKVESVKKNRDNYILTLNLADGSRQTLTLTPYTSLVKNGMPVAAEDLKPGDRVLAYLSSIDGDVPDRVAVAAVTRWGGILKGKLSRSLGDELVLEDVSRFYFGTWLKEAGIASIPVSSEPVIYYKGDVVDKNKLLENFRGQYAYIVTGAGFGRNEAEKIIIKSGDEYLANGEIDEIKWSSGFIEIGGVQAFLADDTAILKSGEFGSPSDIDEDMDVFLVTNRENGNNRAVLVYQPEFYPVNMKIFRGKIDEISRDKLAVDHYSKLENNRWSSKKSSSIDFTLGDYPRIIDATEKTPRLLSKDEFIAERFTGKYDNDYVYVVTIDDRMQGLVILGDEPDAENISIGEVASAPFNGAWITLNNKKDYSAFKEEWNTSVDTMAVNASAALVIKKGELVDKEELSPSDMLYMIRDNNVLLIGVVLE